MNTITPQQIADLVMTLPSDRLASVYDFALFVKEHPLPSSTEVDLFGETAEEIRADEERWEQHFIETRDELRTMAREAAVAYRTGQTEPMAFTPDGRLAR